MSQLSTLLVFLRCLLVPYFLVEGSVLSHCRRVAECAAMHSNSSPFPYLFLCSVRVRLRGMVRERICHPQNWWRDCRFYGTSPRHVFCCVGDYMVCERRQMHDARVARLVMGHLPSLFLSLSRKCSDAISTKDAFHHANSSSLCSQTPLLPPGAYAVPTVADSLSAHTGVTGSLQLMFLVYYSTLPPICLLLSLLLFCMEVRSCGVSQ